MRAKVLVVEDNEMNMQLVEYLLEEGGFDILKATSGEEALRLTASTVPDLILMDIHLPGMDGLSVVREHLARLDGVDRLAADPGEFRERRRGQAALASDLGDSVVGYS